MSVRGQKDEGPELLMVFPSCSPICRCGNAMAGIGIGPSVTITYECVNKNCDLNGIKYKLEPSIIMRKVKE